MNTEKRQNKIIIISSPSGAGKTTICKYLLKKIKNLDLSISYTTRHKRILENNGKDYFFIDKNIFLKLKQEDFFIETAKVFNNFYGSPFNQIKKSFNKNKDILFDIDWQGARKLRQKFNKNQILDFFILPPNKNELKRRLQKRGRDNNNEINIRLSHAINEMRHYDEYRYVLINNNINETVKNLVNIISYHHLIHNLKLDVKGKLNMIK